MWPAWTRSIWPPNAEGQATPASRRDRLAVLLALVTVVCLGLVFFLSKGTQFLMPGQLTSAHGGIEKCSACHTKSGSSKVSWLHGLVAGDPAADSKACLTCHKMSDTAFNAHGVTAEVLKQSTDRLRKIAAATPQPQSARAQSLAFPTHDMAAGGLYCATCHQEHQGANFGLNKISNEQCRSCHVVKFESFDGHHPKFENYPFKRRTRIVYDHAGHFGKHFPEVAKKDPARRIPDTCSSCHNSREDKRVMAVAPFEQTCNACHLNQIIGKERASGPKGIAFLTVPGLDLQTLKKKNASIGEWPDASEAELSPFMKVMISRGERGRTLIKAVDGLNLQDLSKARDDQIKAVTSLVWEIKGLFYALISGKGSDVLADLNIGRGAKLSPALVADLTASIPRDVVMSAQQQWLPNLATEMANRPRTSEQKGTGDQKETGWSTEITGSSAAGSASAQETSAPDAPQPTSKASPEPAKAKAAEPEEDAGGKTDAANAEPDDGTEKTSARSRSESKESESDESDSPEKEAVASKAASKDTLDPPPCVVHMFGQCLMYKGQEEKAAAAKSEEEAGQADTASPSAGKKRSSAQELPLPMQAGLKEVAQADPPSGKAADQTDDLLFPTEEELRGMKAGSKDSDKSAPREGAAGKAEKANTKPDDAGSADAPPKANARAPAAPAAVPVISIDSNVDPESWAEYGGWYRQDYAIYYRPTGHKDKFIYSWLFLTGPQAPKGDKSPVAAVFDYLTSKDAQGSCTKCHSVDDIKGKGRVVNFSPPSVESKNGRFTNFIHEPHMGILENRGCLTCHSLEKGRPYLKSYEQGNPQNFVSNFGEVKKDLCQTCHTASMAREDCLTCHKYHVNGVVTPIMSTKIPAQ